MISGPRITYHLVPRAYWDVQDPARDYLPADFAREGFIHCTDGEFFCSRSANRYLRDASELLVLFIDRERVRSKVVYEDPEQIFPHIYGPLNRDAIVKVAAMVRDSKGEWIFPVQERISV